MSRFSRATGDATALSINDVRLIAVARGLDIARHGSLHLRSEPSMAKPPRRQKKDGAEIPGWGSTGEEWEAMEKLNEEELQAAERAMQRAHASRISRAALTLDGESRVEEDVAAEALDKLNLNQEDEGVEDEDKVEIETWDEDGQAKQEDEKVEDATLERETRFASPESCPAAPEASAAPTVESAQPSSAPAAVSSAGAPAIAPSAAPEEEGEAGEWNSVRGGKSKAALQRKARRQNWRQKKQEGNAHQSAQPSTTAAPVPPSLPAVKLPKTKGPAGAVVDSTVAILTADFAMQNVILQMGLKLLTPDGRRIRRLSRWTLRCTACGALNPQAGRVFCGRCGNASLMRAHLTVGPDGVEQAGAYRDRQSLRGTRYPLPKPKGGRAQDLILAEDVLAQQVRPGARGAPRAAARAKGRGEDPFMVDGGDEGGLGYYQIDALAATTDARIAPLLAGWKHNPNERKATASNRRRKG